MDGVIKKEIGIGALKASINIIPFVGGFINEALFDIRGRIKQERFEKFVELLKEDVDKIEQDKLNKDIIYSEEFSDLVEKIFIKATQTKSNEKVRLYRDMLLNAFVASDLLIIDRTDFFLDIASSLSVNEIIILKHLSIHCGAIWKKHPNKKKHEISLFIDYSQKIIFGVYESDFRLYFDSLISKGLALDGTIGSIGGGRTKGRISLTHLGHGLIQFLLSLRA